MKAFCMFPPNDSPPCQRAQAVRRGFRMLTEEGAPVALAAGDKPRPPRNLEPADQLDRVGGSEFAETVTAGGWPGGAG